MPGRTRGAVKRRVHQFNNPYPFVNNSYRPLVGPVRKPQPKIQVLSCRTPSPHHETLSHQTQLSAEASQSDMESYMSGRILDDNGPPRSSAPISLEDLVKIKPGRNKGNRGSITLEAADAEGSGAQLISDAFDSREGVLSTGQTSAIDSMPPDTSSLNVNSQFSPWQSKPDSALPHDNAFEDLEDGSFRPQNLDNGDVSIHQWSKAQQKWLPLGQIGQSDISLFTRFYDRAYSDHHSDPETWKLYKEHIVATVKQLSRKRIEASTANPRNRYSGPRSTVAPFPLSHSWSNVQTRSKYVASADEKVEPFPPLPTTVRPAPVGTKKTVGPLSPTATPVTTHAKNSSLQRRAVELAPDFIPKQKQAVTLHRPDQDTVTEEERIRAEYRDRERRRIQQGFIVQYPHDGTEKQEDRYAERLPLTETGRYPQSTIRFTEDYRDARALRTSGDGQDLRRTVLHDPIKLPLPSMQAPNRDHWTTAYNHKGKSDQYDADHLPSQQLMMVPPMYRCLDLGPSAVQVRRHEPPRETSFSLQELVESSEPEPPDWSNYASTLNTGTSAASDDSVFAKKLFDPFRGSKSLSSQEPQETAPSRNYEEEVDDFWYSANKRITNKDAINTMFSQATEGYDSEAQAGLRILLPLYESIAAYQLSRKVQAAGGKDYFANFSKPPSWCVERTMAGEESTSLFEYENGALPPWRADHDHGTDNPGRDIFAPTAFDLKSLARSGKTADAFFPLQKKTDS